MCKITQMNGIDVITQYFHHPEKSTVGFKVHTHTHTHTQVTPLHENVEAEVEGKKTILMEIVFLKRTFRGK